jgi:hypothetical protein
MFLRFSGTVPFGNEDLSNVYKACENRPDPYTLI